jgi:hypothetical protein
LLHYLPDPACLSAVQTGGQAGIRKDEEQCKTRQQARAIMLKLKILWPAAMHPL